MKLAEVFGNNMVLQQKTAVPVWGEAAPGERITVTVQGQTVETCADSNGKWELRLNPLQASEHETLRVTGQTGGIELNNVAVGEVWLAGGQSNMEFHMRYDRDFEAEKKNCFNPNIRMFDYPLVISEEARKRFDFSENFGFWRPCDQDNLQWYSAVAYYFARDLQKALQVPVGIIGVNCGGSRSACWMDEETLDRCGRIWMDEYLQGLSAIPDLEAAEEAFYNSPMADHTHPFDNPASERMLFGMEEEELLQLFSLFSASEAMVIGPWHEWRPCGLYHTMLERVMPYAVRGVIWYQGECDEDHPEIYADMMEGLVGLWRSRWGRDLPFITTQLAPLDVRVGNGGKEYPKLREQQRLLTERMRGVYLTSTGDVGHPYDVHPKAKQPVGRRMALLARGHVYGEEILCDAPVPDQWERDGSRLRIAFANADGGLFLNGDSVNALHLYGGDAEIPAEEVKAVVQGNELLIDLGTKYAAESSIRVEFAATPYYEVNLYNKAQIPALPFSLVLPV